MANRAGTADRARGGEESARAPGHTSVVVPGLFSRLAHAAAEAQARQVVEAEFDPRFDEPGGDFTAREGQERAALAEAQKSAEAVAAQWIAKGAPLVGVSLKGAELPRVTFFADPDVRFDVSADDRVIVNVEATARWRAKRAAAKAQIAQRRQPGAQVNGHNPTR